MGALKKIPMGQTGGGECSGFLSFWLGFILSSMKRNMHHVFHIKIGTVVVLMPNAVLACSAKDLLVIFTQPQSQTNSAFKGTAAVI